MADAQDVLNVLSRLEYAIEALPSRIQISANQVKIVTGLSELSEDLGTVLAGEFRAGNQIEPSKGFSGMRMAYPSMLYASEYWNLVGVNNDVLQFGVKAADGKLYAGGGVVSLDANGISIESPTILEDRYKLTWGTNTQLYNVQGFTTNQFFVDVPGDFVDQSPIINLRVFDGNYGSDLVTLQVTLDGARITKEGTSENTKPNLYIEQGLVVGAIEGVTPGIGELWIEETATPSTTTVSGFGSLYVKTDGNLYFMNDAGTEYQLTPVPST